MNDSQSSTLPDLPEAQTESGVVSGQKCDYEEAFHNVMALLKNTCLPHGRCQPRAELACTHCNAQDALGRLIAGYKGRTVRAL